ncbi:MAG TPA: SpoIIE family protein phosphatase, partial [Firmicutes bacterium]|nr:SpoIIE family protein phosphatase [Bacillota bacterium]
LPPTFRERCHQPEVLVKAINNLQEVWQLNRYWEQKVREGKKLVSDQLEGLAQVMEELTWEIEQEPLPTEGSEQAPCFNLELGLAQKAGRNQQVCGDYYSLIELDTTRQAIILGDGMGNGFQAAEESRAAVGMLEKLLEAGLPTETVLRTANSLLQLRSRESFVAVEMALIDLRKGEAELLKIGAAPGFLIKGKEIHQIGASSLPLGILSSVEAERHLTRLLPTDLLVITTDGVADPDGESSWLIPLLRRWESCPPQVIADRILEETLRRCGGFLRDDLTVVTCRLVRQPAAVPE